MVHVVWIGGGMEIGEQEVSAGAVLHEVNTRFPAANFNLVRDQRGDILKPTVLLTKEETVVVLRKRKKVTIVGVKNE